MTRRWVVGFATRGSLLDAREREALDEVLDSSGPLSGGQWREWFEQAFATHVGSRYALSVTSGTTALELAIRMLDLEPGDEVVVTPQTFQATAQPLLDQNVHVRFCDVDPDTLNMDPAVLRTMLGPKVRAIVLVHYGGLPAAMSEIAGMARRRGITVVEDCAHALGSRYRGARPGALGDIGCFSFHTSKNITTLGEGGMVTLDDPERAARISRIRSNDVDATSVPARRPEPGALPWMKYAEDVYRRRYTALRGPGTNATMSDAAAAVGLAQLGKLDALVGRRRMIAERLDETLRGFDAVRLHRAPAHAEHSYHLYTFFLQAGKDARYRLLRELDDRGVEVQLRYFPLHLLPEWRVSGHRIGECPVVERIWFDEHMNLPCHPGMSDAQVEYLAEQLDRSLCRVLDPVRSPGGPEPR